MASSISICRFFLLSSGGSLFVEVLVGCGFLSVVVSLMCIALVGRYIDTISLR